MSHKQYFKKLNPAVFCPTQGFVDPNNPSTLGPACLIHGYIVDPDLAVPPTIEIPPENTAEKIILICSNALESCVSFNVTMSTVGQQYNTKVLKMDGTQLSSVNTTSGTAINVDYSSYGESLVQVVITPTNPVYHLSKFLVTTRTYYGLNGWAIIEAHLYVPYITDLSAAFSALCKLLKYIKFYTNCNSLTTLSSFAGSCDSLKECYFPDQMNALTTAAGAFSFSANIPNPALRIVKWPVSLPVCTNLSNLFRFGGLKQMTGTINSLPASLPELTNIGGMFEYNQTIEEVEITTNLPKLTNASNFILWPRNLKHCRFNCNVGSPTAIADFTYWYGYNYDKLEEIKYPTICYMKMTSSSTTGETCYNLKKITYPEEFHYVSASGAANQTFMGRHNNAALINSYVAPVTCYQDYCAAVWNYSPFLTKYLMPLIKLAGFSSPGNSSLRYKLAEFDCNWGAILTDNFYALPISFSFTYCSFQATEMNRIIALLPDVRAMADYLAGNFYLIDWTQNPGSAANNKLDAVAKGWSVRTGMAGETYPSNPTTNNPTGVTQNSATFSVPYTGNGLLPCKVGVCYKTTSGPIYTNNPKFQMSVTPETISVTITGLTANTTYYVKAFAQNQINVSYGSEISFTTLP